MINQDGAFGRDRLRQSGPFCELVRRRVFWRRTLLTVLGFDLMPQDPTVGASNEQRPHQEILGADYGVVRGSEAMSGHWS